MAAPIVSVDSENAYEEEDGTQRVAYKENERIVEEDGQRKSDTTKTQDASSKGDPEQVDASSAKRPRVGSFHDDAACWEQGVPWLDEFQAEDDEAFPSEWAEEDEDEEDEDEEEEEEEEAAEEEEEEFHEPGQQWQQPEWSALSW